MKTAQPIEGPILLVNTVYSDCPRSVTLFVNGSAILTVRHPDDLAPLIRLRAKYERAMMLERVG